jgi:hypothetical protein
MKLTVASFLGNFSVSVLYTRPKRRSLHLLVISWVNSRCHRHLAFEFPAYVEIFVDMLTPIFLVVKSLPLCERLRWEGKNYILLKQSYVFLINRHFHPTCGFPCIRKKLFFSVEEALVYGEFIFYCCDVTNDKLHIFSAALLSVVVRVLASSVRLKRSHSPIFRGINS